MADAVLAEFIRYNNWANRVVLEACQTLADDQLNTAAPGVYGTIRDTLEHILRAESSYIETLTGQRPQPSFNWDDKPGLPALAEYAGQVGEALTEAAEQVPADKIVGRDFRGDLMRMKAVTLFIQIMNHGIEHRTNITTIISQFGVEAPNVAGWGYFMANQERLGPDEQ